MIESNRKGQRLSFLQLFAHKNYSHIEIPLIQRDYAQGRESAKTVRERFLNSLHDALQDGGHPLSLDFIYGEVKELADKPSSHSTNHCPSCRQILNEEEDQRKCFQPIDGQQRLTTLFLLHWYLACVAGKPGDFAKRMRVGDGKTPRFRYSVRKSSDQFFNGLLDFPHYLANPLSKKIKDQAWFFRAWNHDATIQGALVMVDEINQQFDSNTEKAKTFYNKLCSNECPITFDVLNLGSMGLSDEIYIKMNARGKELTGFEKFKAWLIQNRWDTETDKLSWPEAPNVKQWPILLDGDWLDLFWSFRSKDKDDLKPSESVSKVFFRTVSALAVNFHALNGSFRSEKPLQDEWMTADSDDRWVLWNNIFTKDALKSVFGNLQRLSALEKKGLDDLRKVLKNKWIPFSEVPKKPLFSLFFECEGDLNPEFKERLWLQALCSFLEFPDALRNDIFRDDWFRTIRNLVENTNIGRENFANAAHSISDLAVKCRTESESGRNRPVLRALELLDLKAFDGKQNKEEATKAGLMLQNQDGSEWEKTILVAENHPVFLGQIGLLLDGGPTLEDFQKRWAVVNDLLDGAGSKIGKVEYLLARTALSQCEPIKLGKLEFKDIASQWKPLLGSTTWDAKGLFRKGMLKLIDHLKDCYTNNYQSKMESLCKNSVAGDWMDDVIRYGHILLQWGPNNTWLSSEQKVQNYKGNGTFIYFQTNWSPERDIMLGKQAHWRNSIIKSLLESEIGLSIAKRPEVVPQIVDAISPFYRGHQFYLQPENQLWRIHIQYSQIVLQQRNATDSPQSSTAETWNPAPVCSFKFSENPSENTKNPEEIAEDIKTAINSKLVQN